ncbi:unnamed protein product [Linum tenue]|uniref:Late embryogenesis abundant protein LEA-2 subgroup domain-containing protein n=1 Tax=Linum tenue TaxID=586396 RepID=A0AAV0NQL1_9ROSI|nr:unnamed protein product [Linum tenue]
MKPIGKIYSEKLPYRKAAQILIAAVVIVSAVIVALALTVFRPRDPTVTIDLVGLSRVQLKDLVFAKNLTTAVAIGISNDNYGSFAWTDFTTAVKYNGQVVGEIPIREKLVPQRSYTNITTSITMQLDKLNEDLAAVAAALTGGGLNLTCSVTVYGKIRPLRIWPRFHGSVYVDCVSSLYVNTHRSGNEFHIFKGQSTCWTKLKLT